MQDRLELARYAHLPIASLGGDWELAAADAQMARALREAGHLLWITDPGLPDVAGRGDDDAESDVLAHADPVPLEVRGRSLLAKGFCGATSVPLRSGAICSCGHYLY